MLRNMVQKEIILYAMAILVIICVAAKMIWAITVRKMVRASREIHKSNHRFMKLIKSKFEHATLVSERVQNVEAFVEKHLYEYKVLGLRLQAWGSIVKTLIWLIGILGVIAIFESYRIQGWKDLTIEYLQWTGLFLLLLLLLQVVEDEAARLRAAKNYIIEYLENVCAHRYEKMHLKEERKEEVSKTEISEEKEEIRQEIQVAQEVDEEQKKSEQEKRIRAILEEFLA